MNEFRPGRFEYNNRGEGCVARVVEWFRSGDFLKNKNRALYAMSLVAALASAPGCQRETAEPSREPARAQKMPESGDASVTESVNPAPEIDKARGTQTIDKANAEEPTEGSFTETPVDEEKAASLVQEAKTLIAKEIGADENNAEIQIFRIKIVGEDTMVVAYGGEGGEEQDVVYAIIDGESVRIVLLDDWFERENPPVDDLDEKVLECLWNFNRDGNMGQHGEDNKVTNYKGSEVSHE